MHIATVCGTRPELIKLAPLVPVLAERFEHTYLFTGQHYSPSMVQVFVDELDAPAPDRFLDVGTSDAGALEVATEAALKEIAPDLILVYGDTNSTLAAGRAAETLGIPLVHIEAGIRSFDRSMPEELNRVVVDKISVLRLAPTGLATWFLEAFEGYDRVTSPAVGNLVVDAWRRHKDMVMERPIPAQFGGADRYAVMTLHRQATVDVADVFARALAEFATLDMPIFFPVHPRTAKRVEEFGLTWPDNIRIAEPMGYLDFVRAMAGATVLLTDSGGVQEEAITLDIPCVTLRPNTERMETVFLGGNRLFDLEKDTGLAAVVADAIPGHADRPYKVNPFGSGYASERCAALFEMMAGRTPTAEFPDQDGLATLADLQAAADAVRSQKG
jgi:UDP-N-acetylglucosamine 2-epimerase (non-hydrolysing)